LARLPITKKAYTTILKASVTRNIIWAYVHSIWTL